MSAPSHYRPQLDGLRAIAVYLVVAFHAGVASFTGGFVGVDVFFVLSGYLVTRLLLRDIGSMARIDFRRFYSRRFRRLLPAAFAALLISACVYVAVATPADAASALGGFRSAFLYVANWHFISQSSDYFATNVNTNPVLHFWSLAVEEQFYLFWPLLLSLLFVITRRAGRAQWTVIRAIVAVAAAASLVAALLISRTNLSRAYYGTDTRAYELVGALLAMSPFILRAARKRRGGVHALAPVSVVLIILLATSSIHLGAIQRGLAITVATCVLILSLEVAENGIVARMLSRPTAVYLGQVSYGTYLWHWPVIILITLRFHPGGWQLFALTCLVGTALASLSYELLERTVRQSRLLDAYRVPVIAAGLAISVISGVAIVPAILNRDRGSSAVAIGVADSGGGGGWRIPVPGNLSAATKSVRYGGVSCFQSPVDQCIVTHGTKQRLLLVGDSHALTFIPTFTKIAKQHSMTFAVAYATNCAWQRGIAPTPIGQPASGPAACRSHQNDWYQRVIPQYDPDIVVLASRGLEDPANHTNIQTPDGSALQFGKPGFDDAIRTASAQSLAQLRRPGRKIVIIEPLPLAPVSVDPASCLSGAKFLEDCRYVATMGSNPVLDYYRSVSDGTQQLSLDLDRLVCPYFPICDPVVDGVVVKADRQHITAAYAVHIAGPVDAVLARNGVFG